MSATEKIPVTVKKVNKRGRLSARDAIRYQLLTHCFLNDIPVSGADVDCLTLLAITGPQELTSFCTRCSSEQIFKSAQSTRNALSKVEKKHLIVKEGKNKKKIRINPELMIETEGTILLDFEFLVHETN